MNSKFWEKVVVGKVNMDTMAAAFFLGVTRKDEVVILLNKAEKEDLNNPFVLCIEAGGHGCLSMANLDRVHAQNSLPCVVRQAWELKVFPERYGFPQEGILDDAVDEAHATLPPVGGRVSPEYRFKIIPTAILSKEDIKKAEEVSEKAHLLLEGAAGKTIFFLESGDWGSLCEAVIRYVEVMEEEGEDGMRRRLEDAYPEFPTLSDVFNRMIAITPDPKEQLFRGIEMIWQLLEMEVDPFKRIPVEEIPQWQEFVKTGGV